MVAGNLQLVAAIAQYAHIQAYIQKEKMNTEFVIHVYVGHEHSSYRSLTDVC